MTQSPSPIVDEVADTADLALVLDLRRLAAATRDCSVCDGDGIKANGNQCGGCGGTGKVPAWWGVEKTLAAAADRLASLVSPPKAGAGEPVGYVTRYDLNEVAQGRIGGNIYPAGTLRPENEIPLYANHEARGDHIPDPGKMVAHEPRGDGVRVTDAVVERAMSVFIKEVRDQVGPEWTDEFDEEVCLISPTGDGFAPFFPLRKALEATLPPLGDGRAEIVEECAKVADALAERQAETNRKYPDHVKAYPAWEAYVSKYREVAAAIRSLSNPGGSE